MTENKKCPICGQEYSTLDASCTKCTISAYKDGWAGTWNEILNGKSPADFPDCEGLQKRLREVEENRKKTHEEFASCGR